MPRIVHITHEAVKKIGGIGTVLEGMLTSRTYRERIERTILMGPLQEITDDAADRLGPGGQVYYSSIDGNYGGPHPAAFRSIEEKHGVRLVYGERIFIQPETGEQIPVETLLVNLSSLPSERVSYFKYRLWQSYGLDSARHDAYWEFELYMRIAEPGYEALKHLLGVGGPNVFISHDFMGMGTILKVLLTGDPADRTVFHAHEVASARGITEGNSGHDTMFYNVLRAALSEGKSIEDIWGGQGHYFKHPLFQMASRCDAIFAVGDLIVEELRFLGPEFRHLPIECVYNGVPADSISWEERQHSRRQLQEYAAGLVGGPVDYIFSHVARPVLSKAFWRDFQLLMHLDRHLQRRGQRAVLFLLASEGSARRAEHEVIAMEESYGWPVYHRSGWPDLTGSEVGINDAVQSFNLGAKNIRAVYLNQYGWSHGVCGRRMPEAMEFRDLRRGSDVELGLSIYEPFGIALLEPLTYGAVSVISSVCGCRGFIEKTGGLNHPNVLIGDYTRLTGWNGNAMDYLWVDRRTRDRNEVVQSFQLANELNRRLSTKPSILQQRLASGYELASRMSCDAVVRDQFLPGLKRINA